MNTILVVDDDYMNLVTVREVLNDEYKVIPVKKGQQAFSYLENGTCDLILLDINMPEMNGYEVMHKIREFDSFHHVYNFIRRFVERGDRNVQTLLFTVTDNENNRPDPAETETAVELLEKSIYSCLRRSDISTRYSGRQVIVILIDSFFRMYTGGKIHIEYGIARLDGRGNVS